MCCQPQRSGLLRSLPCRGHRHAGYNFPSLFRNTLDSHRYLDLKDWPAISTSMSLRPPFSEGGTRWLAKGQRQRRPYASFYCVLLRPSRTRFAQLKSRHRASKRDLNAAFFFHPVRGMLDLLIVRWHPALSSAPQKWRTSLPLWRNRWRSVGHYHL